MEQHLFPTSPLSNRSSNRNPLCPKLNDTIRHVVDISLQSINTNARDGGEFPINNVSSMQIIHFQLIWSSSEFSSFFSFPNSSVSSVLSYPCPSIVSMMRSIKNDRSKISMEKFCSRNTISQKVFLIPIPRVDKWQSVALFLTLQPCITVQRETM